MDSEGLLQCPYDKNHMIRPSRFPYHLVKCRENNKAVAKVLATCPFNARHRVPKKELDLHMQNCESRCTLDPLPVDAVTQKEECFSAWKSPPCEESWDDEYSSSTPSAFVLNEFGNYQPYCKHENTCEKSPPRTPDVPSQEGYRNAWKPAVPTGKPAVPTGKPAVPTGKPAVPTGNPWSTYQNGAARNPEPVSHYEAEWPSLSNHRTKKEPRQPK